MSTHATTFGRAISARRKELKLSQKELAEKVVKEDGVAITPQYLNDIEHDRRSPSSDHIVQQFAERLGMASDYLYYLAGRMPSDLRERKLSPQQVTQVLTAFRRSATTKK